MLYKGTLESPVGPVQIIAEDHYIIRLDFYQGGLDDCQRFLKKYFPGQSFAEGFNKELIKAIVQLDEYFSGTRKTFDLNVKLYGTPFYGRVWSELCKIPYGELISYKTLTERCDAGKAFRAVGQANHNNPISVIVPCHRVVGANGKLTGYGSGLEVKQYLIDLEQKNR